MKGDAGLEQESPPAPHEGDVAQETQGPPLSSVSDQPLGQKEFFDQEKLETSSLDYSNSGTLCWSDLEENCRCEVQERRPR